ncbi:hypothetical protein GCM10025771_08850 [Niveibacterium umoris]|uniref:Uncharacterized protein n=1 Tax=Niveibacterium umoris TaxID=1193620 RepID=A0A840BRW8_9RHOO|nr:hypothetical protein [Niveibacterium umoris]MBB4013566.1 hypothetical protein [Niveibacterium umoris]
MRLLPRLMSAMMLATLSATAGAAPVKILGFDDMSCVAWNASKNDAEVRAQQIAWVRGFLSGHNYARQSEQVSVVSAGTVETFVNRHCGEKTRSTLAEAAQRMSDQYSGRNAAITK